MGVRIAEMNDIATMSYIHSQTWKIAYVDYISHDYLSNIADDGWIPLFSKALREKIHEAAVFDLNGIVTGTITFGQERMGEKSYGEGIKTEQINFEGEIISLYVLPEYWSTKQGYELMKFAVERLRQQGFESCFLWVIRDNERAVRFYKRFGFASTNELLTVNMAGRPLVEEKYRIML